MKKLQADLTRGPPAGQRHRQRTVVAAVTTRNNRGREPRNSVAANSQFSGLLGVARQAPMDGHLHDNE